MILLIRQTSRGETPLSLALAANNRFIMAAFHPYLLSALVAAIEKNQPDQVDTLLATELDVNQQDESSEETPLHLAARLGKNQLVKKLLHKGAGTQFKNNNGRTPVEEALIKGHNSVVLLLLDHDNGATWFSAARNEAKGLVERFLNAGAAIDRQDSLKSETALHKAAKAGDIGMVDFLLERGASKHLKNRDRKTACQLARAGGPSADCRQIG